MAKNRTKIAHILSGDILSKGIAFFITIYLTRVFGKEGYGMVTVAMAYLGYASFFADFGLFNIGTREVAKTLTKRVFQPFEILVARMFLATLIFVIVWLALPFILADIEQLILTRRFLFSLLIHAYLVEWYFNGLQRYDLIAFSRTLQMAVYGLGVFIFIKSSSDILHLPIFYIFGLLISAIILLSIAFNNKAFTYSKKGISLYK